MRVINAMASGPTLSDNEPDAISELIKEKELLTELLQTVRDRIAEIKSSYPYTMKPIIQSYEKTEIRKTELEDSIRQLNETLVVYTDEIQEILK